MDAKKQLGHTTGGGLSNNFPSLRDSGLIRRGLAYFKEPT